MPVMRKPFVRKIIAPAQKEGEKQQGLSATEPNQLNVEESQGTSGAQQNIETPEQKPTQENHPQHIHVESAVEDKDKKVIKN